MSCAKFYEHMIGQRYGNLSVESFDPESLKFTCVCECGAKVITQRARLIKQHIWCCRACKEKEKYLRSLAVDMSLLSSLMSDQAQSVLKAYGEHLSACMRSNVRATGWQQFVREFLQDPTAFVVVTESREVRLARAVCQRYHQYTRPRFAAKAGSPEFANR